MAVTKLWMVHRALVICAVVTAAMPLSADVACDYGPAYDPATWSCVGGSAAGDPCAGSGDPVCVDGSCELGPGGQHPSTTASERSGRMPVFWEPVTPVAGR